MKNLVCRRLQADDIEIFQSLLQSRKYPPISLDDVAIANSKRLQSLRDGHPHYGVFSSGELLATISLYRWTKLPYFTISELTKLESIPETIKLLDIIGPLFEAAIIDMIMEKRFSFFYLMKQSHFSTIDKKSEASSSWLEKKIILLKNYVFTFEYLIEANSMPEFTSLKEMMGHNHPNQNFVLRKASLKSPSFFKLNQLVNSGSSAIAIKEFMLSKSEATE